MSASLVKIIYAVDFHGSDACFRKFLGSVPIYKPNILIGGGDIAGKAIVPIIHKGGGIYEGYLFGAKETVSTREERAKFRQAISNVGFYPLELEPEEAEELENNEEKMAKVFDKMIKDRLEEWLTLAEDYLKKEEIQFYFMGGNDDPYIVDDIIKGSSLVKNPDETKFWLDDNHEIIGLSSANMTPWKCPRDISEEELTKKIERVVSLLEKPENAIFSFHCPPYDSQLDLAPELDEKMRIKHAGGQVIMVPVGSTAVRKAIDSYQPLLTFHGHIHESAGFRRLGRTLAVNPGSEYAEGIFKGALIILDKDKVKGHMSISG